MWHTYAAMGDSTVWLLSWLPIENSFIVPVLMVFAVVGAVMPDFDALECKIKHANVLGIKPFVPVSKAINQAYGHRGLLHSL